MIQEFISYLRSIRGYSPNTCIAYEKDIRAFAQWARKRNPGARWSTNTRQDIDAYITEQEQRGLKATTTNRQIAAISALYNYLKRQGHDIDNPCKWETRRKLTRNIPNTIPDIDIQTAYAHAQGLTKTMLGILATTGIRIQELLNITREDMDEAAGTLKVLGKGRKVRLVHCSPAILQDLAKVRATSTHHGKMFNLDQRTARYMIYQALRPYTNARQLSPHAIRHSFATHLATNGENVAIIARALGHKDIKTTQIYIDMTQIETRRASLHNPIIQ